MIGEEETVFKMAGEISTLTMASEMLSLVPMIQRAYQAHRERVRLNSAKSLKKAKLILRSV